MQTVLILTSNEHSEMFRMMTNGDLCDFQVFCGFSSSRELRKMAAKINATECNTLPIVCNIYSSTVLLSEHQYYI